MSRLSPAEIERRCRAARIIADRIEVYRQRRIDRLARESGIGRSGSALHNALLSASQGRPWREINYSKARLLDRVWNDNRHYDRVTALTVRLMRQR